MKTKEDVKHLTFVKWEEADSIIFISKNGKPIFMGDELEIESPLLMEYNANKNNKSAYQEINKNNLGKLRQKADDMLLLQRRKESSEIEQTVEEGVLYQ